MTRPIIVDALRQIQKRNRQKKLLPSDVVKEAENPESPLHSKFCWDDGKAAHEYRLWQARQLIASVEVVYDGPQEKAPAFVSLYRDRKDGGYRSVSDVLANKELHAEMVATALEEAKAYQDRYHRLKELQPIFNATKRVERTVKRNHKKVAS